MELSKVLDQYWQCFW